MKDIATALKAVYDGIMRVYAELFNAWADYNFFIKLALFFALLLLLYIFFKYAVIPVLLLAYANIILRFWNYLVIESCHEVLYLLFMSNTKKKPPNFFAVRYKNFERSVEKNRAYIDKVPLTDGLYVEQTYRKVVNNRLKKNLLKIVNFLMVIVILMFVFFLVFHYVGT